MIICVFLLFVAGMATTTVERDCHEGMRVVDTDKECNLKYGSICPNMVEWCAAWEISPNGPETGIAKRSKGGESSTNLPRSTTRMAKIRIGSPGRQR